MVDYKKLYEKQYGEKKLINSSLGKFWGLRKFLKKYDWDRYFIAEQFIETGERALDIGCGNGCMLRKVNDKFQELYGVDIFPSRLRKAEDKVKKLFLKIF
jgi:ubiquinone/menaquinone biosynthesis C-methylase UbiE